MSRFSRKDVTRAVIKEFQDIYAGKSTLDDLNYSLFFLYCRYIAAHGNPNQIYLCHFIVTTLLALHHNDRYCMGIQNCWRYHLQANSAPVANQWNHYSGIVLTSSAG